MGEIKGKGMFCFHTILYLENKAMLGTAVGKYSAIDHAHNINIFKLLNLVKLSVGIMTILVLHTNTHN